MRFRFRFSPGAKRPIRLPSSRSAARRVAQPGRIGEIEHRVAAASELDALETRGQKAAAPVVIVEDLAAGGALADRGHDGKGRQVVGLAAETVGEPGAHRWEPVEGVAGRHEVFPGAVRIRLTRHRMDETHLIGQLTELGDEL